MYIFEKISNFTDEQIELCKDFIRTIKATTINLTTLHRNLVGGNWFTIHELLGDYYNEMSDFEDKFVENFIGLGLPDASIAEASNKLLEPQKYNEREALELTKGIFQGLLDLTNKLREAVNFPACVMQVFDEFENWLHIEADFKLDNALV